MSKTSIAATERPIKAPLTIQRFEVSGLAQYAYIVSSDGLAAVVDPMRDVDAYLAYAAQHDLRITHVVETHIHADFASGATALASATGAELALSGHDEGQLYQYAMPHRPLHDGDIITLGDLQITALHTPGHTPEHISFLVNDADGPLALLSGDFLFVGSLGRPDLLGDDAKLGLARDLHRSLHERIAHLPAEVELLPGHGAGSFCGSGMSDRPDSTLGIERATNPLFRLSADAFVSTILASVPAMPLYYPRMKSLNAHGAAIFPALPGGTPLSIAEISALAEQGATLLDLRHPEVFAAAHIPNSLNIGADGNLSLWAGWLIDPAQPIVLIADAGDDEPARRALLRVGLDHIAGYLAGGFSTWLGADAPCSSLALAEASPPSPGTLVLDVRNPAEFASGHIAGARNIPLGELPDRASSLPADHPILTVCGSAYRSSVAASLLARDGFTDLSSLSGGMDAWTAQGLPLTPLNKIEVPERNSLRV